ncbi:hypothetical protein J6590_099766 [Homalodisca vitripennis]|nr:hypothetical protein J6590_099766 [Homalodisca vitripennis]
MSLTQSSRISAKENRIAEWYSLYFRARELEASQGGFHTAPGTRVFTGIEGEAYLAHDLGAAIEDLATLPNLEEYSK